MKIIAVVVTYERVEFIKDLLNSLLSQKPELFKIIIVDNSIGDSILKIIKSIYGEDKKENIEHTEVDFSISLLSDKILYVKTKDNIGGAGGFKVGIEIAENFSSDWFWLMDDDVEPMPGALEYQLQFTNISECINPSKKAPDGEFLEWWGWLDLKTLREKPIPEENFRENYAFVNMACFEGLLISKKIVEKIGLPNPEFFIYGDDVVYGYKASLYTQCIYLTKPTFIKKLKKKNFHKRFGKYYPFASNTLSYYLMRNYLLRAKEIKKVTPNRMNITRAYLFHFYYYIKQMVKALVIERNFKKLLILTKGFIDSFRLGR